MEKKIDEPVEKAQEKIKEQPEEQPKKQREVGIPKRAVFSDGSYRQYEYNFPTLEENAEYNKIVSMLGLSGQEEARWKNEIGEIGRLVYSWLGTTNEEQAYKFIRHNLRRTPQTGSRVMNLLRQLQILFKESHE